MVGVVEAVSDPGDGRGSRTPRSVGTRAGAAAVAAIGLAAVAALAWALGLPTRDVAVLVGIAGGSALAVGLVGAGVLQLLRGRSFASQAIVVALTSTVAVAAGALAAGRAMFISTHDLSALAVVVAVAAVVGVCSALLLGHRVGSASASLDRAARRIAAAGDAGTAAPAGRTILELDRLARQLDETAAELAASRERERAVEQARRDLVSWVSHDLRTPLAGIRAIAEALEDGIVDDAETIARYYRTLRTETDRLAALVDDLFELSTIGAGAVTLDYDAVPLGELVSEVVAAAAPLAQRGGIRLEGVVDPHATIEASPPEIARVLRNLVGNAVRETPHGGTVRVEGQVAGAHAYLAVEDTCGGISPDVLPRVFEAGYRGQHARTPTGERGGAGLGLAIAKGLVSAHGGAIGVRNTARGCRFEVRLPVRRPTPWTGAEATHRP